MAFELRVGWRYLYSGTRSKYALIGLMVCSLLSALGAALTLTQNAVPGGLVIILIAAMIPAAVCLLLYLFSVFTSVSVLGVTFGVAALTMVLSITSGMQQQFREKVLGVNAHVLIQQVAGNMRNPDELEKFVMELDDQVISAQPFMILEMLITRGRGQISGVGIKGVVPDKIASVLDLKQHIVEGSIESLAEERTEDRLAPIIIGQELQRKLKAKIGDKVTIIAPLSDFDPETGTRRSGGPATRAFRVAAIFYSGFDEYDRRLTYVNLKEAQAFFSSQNRDQVHGLELKVKDVDNAKAIAERIDAALAQTQPFADTGPYKVIHWYEMNRNLFTALAIQKVVLVLILAIIVIVAAFNLVSALTMMVTEKTKEIAIMRSMGTSSASVFVVFQVVGLTIASLGTALGIGIGLSLCQAISKYGYKLDPKVYQIDHLPISTSPMEIIAVAIGATMIGGIATVIPSLRAAGLKPVEGLRYE